MPSLYSVALDLLAQILSIAACVIIIWRTEPALNRMSRCTPLLVRLAFWLIVVASASAIVMIALGDVPPWPSVLGVLGTAALLFCERRLRYLTRHPKNHAHG